MACYYFRKKSDRNTKGGRISALNHLKYINREDEFANEGLTRDEKKFLANLISSASKKNVADGNFSLLYDSKKSIRVPLQILLRELE